MNISIVLAAGVIALVLALYFLVYRPRQLVWGAELAEIDRPMPGDEIVERPTFNSTRALFIDAEAQDIYPWICQMGIKRGGWYSYDLLDNLGKPSAESILSEYQNPKPGDLIPMSPDGKQGIWVKDMKLNEWMLWWDKKGFITWVWGIYSTNTKGSRLVTRVRMRYEWFSFNLVGNLLIEFADFFMMRKCLLGIKRRAEGKTKARLAA